jgi:hypothetical protein
VNQLRRKEHLRLKISELEDTNMNAMESNDLDIKIADLS